MDSWRSCAYYTAYRASRGSATNATATRRPGVSVQGKDDSSTTAASDTHELGAADNRSAEHARSPHEHAKTGRPAHVAAVAADRGPGQPAAVHLRRREAQSDAREHVRTLDRRQEHGAVRVEHELLRIQAAQRDLSDLLGQGRAASVDQLHRDDYEHLADDQRGAHP